MNAQEIVPFGEQGSTHSTGLEQFGSAPAHTTGKAEAAGAVFIVSVDQLRPHPLIAEIYGDSFTGEDSLQESIRGQGILSALLVIPDGRVLSGAERLRVAQVLGMREVPVRVLDLRDATEIEAKVIESNVARQKTVEQRIREYRHPKRIEAVKAAARQGTRHDLLENLPESEAGNARDLAASKVGWCGRTAEKAARCS